ncbi:MAG: zinc-binding alcohol dehydrogenase [Clostridia bacterium]|nr:zinc-binding alcohol dehydrogenase [Clostridia bacterium]
MERKKIVFTAPLKAELQTEQIGELQAGMVLVKTLYSTVSSGTERANLIGKETVSPNRHEDGIATYPRCLGYSTAGIVEAVGEGVTRVKVGDRVASIWTIHTNYNIVPEKNLTVIDESISLSEAAIWPIASFPLAAIRKTRLEMGETALVMGLGVLGLTAIQLLRAAGASVIVAVDPIPEKRELALKIGADYAFDPFAEDFEANVRRASYGGINVAIEVTGNCRALDMVLDCMQYFGRVALLGCTRTSDFNIDYYKKVHAPGITLVGAHTMARPQVDSSNGWWTERADMQAIYRLVKSGRLSFAQLIEETHSPKEAPEVYTRLANEKAFPMVQFDWSLCEEGN